MDLLHVQSIENQHIVVVLGQGDNVPFSCDLESTATTDLHVGALELTDQRSIFLKDSNMEAVAVTVTY